MLGVGSFVWSACVVINMSICETLKQIKVPALEIGRTSAAIGFLSWGIELVGAGIAALMALAEFGVPTILLVSAAGLTFSAVWVMRSERVILSEN